MLGRVLTAASPLGTVSYQYDAVSRRTRTTWPGSGLYVDYDYDLTGAVTAIRENGATSGIGVLASYAYDNLGRRTSLTRGNGVVTSYGFDAASRLSSLGLDLAGTANDQSVTFSYNPAGQIVERDATNAVYKWWDAVPMTAATAVDALNRATNVGGTAIAHDARGNVTGAGAATWGYDADNRLVSGSDGLALQYDALGRLYETAKTWWATTQFLYDGADLIAEYEPGSSSPALLRRYVHGPGADEPLVWYEGTGTSDRRFLVADERGSIVAITDSSGGVISHNAYDPYGKPGGNNLGRFQYTGQQWIQEAGLYYYKARFYNADLGRFMQTDPIGYADGMNLYAYVGNDPVNRRDPSGLSRSVTDEIVVSGSLQRKDYNPLLGGRWPVDSCGSTCWIYDRNPSSGAPLIGLGDYGWVQSGGARGPAGIGGEVSGGRQPNGSRSSAGGTQKGDFHYRVRDFAFCGADELFDQFSKPGNSAPGAPAAIPGTTPDIVLTGGNPITQVVDPGARTITNITQDGHRYHSGTVEIRIAPTWYGSAVSIEGRGTGPHYLENRILGAALFFALATRATIACTVGAD